MIIVNGNIAIPTLEYNIAIPTLEHNLPNSSTVIPGQLNVSFAFYLETRRHRYGKFTTIPYRERKFRDLVLALESTGDLGCLDAL